MSHELPLRALSAAQLARKAAVWLLQAPIHAYRLLVAPSLGPNCRYFPSCSAYALQALADHGPLRGSYLAAHRICRCGPWGAGGVDEVPEAPRVGRTPLFSKFVSHSE